MISQIALLKRTRLIWFQLQISSQTNYHRLIRRLVKRNLKKSRQILAQLRPKLEMPFVFLTNLLLNNLQLKLELKLSQCNNRLPHQRVTSLEVAVLKASLCPMTKTLPKLRVRWFAKPPKQNLRSIGIASWVRNSMYTRTDRRTNTRVCTIWLEFSLKTSLRNI